MCGCASAFSVSAPVSNTNQSAISTCDYTIELMYIWKAKLECIRTNNLFDQLNIQKYKINFAIGTVDSAINTGDACPFKKQLDEINGIILSLINLGKC